MEGILLAVGLALVLPSVHSEFTCAGVGYFPDPADCSTFYRCTDIYGNGLLQTYMFECPGGTVFDDKIDVCNWPWAVPSCNKTPPPMITSTQPPSPPSTTVAETTEAAVVTTESTAVVTTMSAVVETTQSAVVDETTPIQYTPAAGSPYSCMMPGVVEYEADCQKFWLCKENPEASRILESLLYRCPEGYLFASTTLRCAPAEDISCMTAATERGLPSIQLSIAELDSFFNRFG